MKQSRIGSKEESCRIMIVDGQDEQDGQGKCLGWPCRSFLRGRFLLRGPRTGGLHA